MADTVTGLPNRGTTYHGSTKTLDSSYGMTVGLEGTIRAFKDMGAKTAAGVQTQRSDRTQTCMLVRNVSGITLVPKRLVTWASGYIGKRVDGYACVNNVFPAGVVDEQLPSTGVRN